MRDLTDQERAVLEMASRRYRYAGRQEQAIRDELGLSAVAFWVQVNRLLDEPAAEVAFPALVHRLQRLREQRARLTSPRVA